MIYWIIFSIASGVAEASIFSQVIWKNKTRSRLDEHFYLNILRLVVLLGTCSGLNVAFAPLLFPLLHDGAYYEAYRRFMPGKYPLGWRDQSTTTDAFFSIPFFDRAVLAAAGCVGWFTQII